MRRYALYRESSLQSVIFHIQDHYNIRRKSTVTYLTVKKQVLSEGQPGRSKLLGANFSAPEIKWFKLFEVGKEGDADQPGVEVTLLVPLLGGYELNVLAVHRYHASGAFHQERVLFVVDASRFGGNVHTSTTLEG